VVFYLYDLRWIQHLVWCKSQRTQCEKNIIAEIFTDLFRCKQSANAIVESVNGKEQNEMKIAAQNSC